MKLLWIVSVALLPSLSFAQVSSEEAKARLEAREKERLANQANDRIELDKLRREVVALKAENERLRKELADLKAEKIKPLRRGGSTAANEAFIKGWLDQKRDAAEIAEILKQSQEIDAAVADSLPEKVKNAALACYPTPGMPKELLFIFGTMQPETETENSMSGKFRIYGYSNTWWPIVIDGDKVSVVHERDGRRETHTRIMRP